MPSPSTSHSDGRQANAGTPIFPSIACAVDGTRAGFEAARQAAVLAHDGSALRLLAVTWETGTRASAMVELGVRRATDALERAVGIARDLGVHAGHELIAGPDAGTKLLDATRGDDLLVIGSSGRSHGGGLVLGHAADAMLRRASGPVLLARRTAGAEFLDSIMIAATDPTAVSDIAARLAGFHGAVVTVMAMPDTPRDAIDEAVAAISAHTRVEPIVVDGHGRIHAAAAHLAGELDASLIVTAGEHAIRIAECTRRSVLLSATA